MKTKIFSLILAALMLSSAFLTGCSEGTKNSETDANPAVGADTPSPDETAAEEETEEFPYDKADYDGFNFGMLVRGPSYGFWESNEMWAEDMSGEVLNDAVRERILQIESMYDVTVTVMKSTSSVLNDATKVIQAAQDEYQMILGASSDVSSLAINKMAVDMNTIDSLHLDNPWWDQAANKGLSIANKLYYSTGDISYDLYRATEAVLFNKVMLGEYNLEDPYTLVREGTWTIDKMLEMSQGVSMDVDGNGTYDEKDKYGMDDRVKVWFGDRWLVEFEYYLGTFDYTVADAYWDGDTVEGLMTRDRDLVILALDVKMLFPEMASQRCVLVAPAENNVDALDMLESASSENLIPSLNWIEKSKG